MTNTCRITTACEGGAHKFYKSRYICLSTWSCRNDSTLSVICQTGATVEERFRHSTQNETARVCDARPTFYEVLVAAQGDKFRRLNILLNDAHPPQTTLKCIQNIKVERK
jgi:hypothetical protein